MKRSTMQNDVRKLLQQLIQNCFYGFIWLEAVIKSFVDQFWTDFNNQIIGLILHKQKLNRITILKKINK